MQAVSYTHLDVYKRQGVEKVLLLNHRVQFRVMPGHQGGFVVVRVLLDVYKRQVLLFIGLFLLITGYNDYMSMKRGR